MVLGRGGRLVVLLLVAGCGPRETVHGNDGSGDSAPPLRDTDVAESGDATDAADGAEGVDVEPEPEPGPATFVGTGLSLSLERLCDFDGDGLGDNAVANLGPTAGGVFVGAFDSFAGGLLEEGRRLLTHVPWIDDRATPRDDDLVMIFAVALDIDDPPNPDDDFDGDEPFVVDSRSLDACGEPKSAFMDAILDVEGFSGAAEELPVPIGHGRFLTGRNVECWGRATEGWRGSEGELCFYSTVDELGALPPFQGVGDLTPLEFMVAGGAAAGYPALPGISPDVDVDGDGLETFHVAEDGTIARCVDGDLTVIEGRDCWQDVRIADGFALTVEFDLVAATFAGREPGWEQNVDGECAEPPEESLWDPR